MPDNNLQKFWNIADAGEDEAEITMYGNIFNSQPKDWWTGEPVAGLFITPEGFLEDLERIKGKRKITIKLNSSGGDLYTGIAIHNALKGLTGHKTVKVEGIAASSASVIMCAGDDVQVYPGSMVMIHGVSGIFQDYLTIDDLKKAIKSFDAAEKAIAEIYSKKTGTQTETLRNMMNRETWMVGEEAIDRGFADTLLINDNSDVAITSDKKFMLVAGIRHDVSYFRNVPEDIPIIIETKNTNEGGVSQMKTIEELKQAYPELTARIENLAKEKAISAERNRIKEIDSIEASIGDRSLVFDAKYGEMPCTAQELAFKALQKEALLGAQHLNNVEKDAVKSGVNSVQAIPNGGKETEEEDEVLKINAVVNAYKKLKGGKK